ncbi:tyrosine-protein phosphatase [Marinobacterium sediminicola]|uniref:protein-tyrosine-phosphatase n=1 Tax=Marinobacterium sediminicola TaxID=518898 RepID=A0ABY1S0V1_9GAMM|nr:CpsB/CapC family capsule biosynthesis tyrosine phosphatase [Marinobacterium sediminicola]ULG68371.1 capsular biosynthesis protein [Marinobacterium sediminicola]SMR74750.1 protein-tyrosine phosphatase [Marinobacterium sediminicola]
MGMIDLHNHLLPGIDDGAEDVSKSIELARMAVADGITHLVCTPHIHPGRYENSPATIEPALELFRSALIEAGITLKVSSAAEVRFGLELMEGVARQAVPFLGEREGRKVMLLEFPHGEIPFGAEKLTRWLMDRRITPMIAHPERNKAVMKSPSKLKPFLDQGCLLQVTAASVAGRFGESAQSIAHQLLAEDKVFILATDAHNSSHRPPVLREGLQAAAAIVGDRQAAALVTTNPWSIAEVHF